MSDRGHGLACANCRKNIGTIKWTGDGGALAITHGFYEWWCEDCALEAQIIYAEKQAARLPELYAKREQRHGTTSPAPRPSLPNPDPGPRVGCP